MLVQYLPSEGGHRMPDLPGDGDFGNPATADKTFVESDKWTEAKAHLATLADTITVMAQGMVIAEGPPDEIKGNPKVQEAYLGGAHT